MRSFMSDWNDRFNVAWIPLNKVNTSKAAESLKAWKVFLYLGIFHKVMVGWFSSVVWPPIWQLAWVSEVSQIIIPTPT